MDLINEYLDDYLDDYTFDTIHHPINGVDIVVTPTDHWNATLLMGEWCESNADEHTQPDRLFLLITNLITRAAKLHLKMNFTKENNGVNNFKVKPGHENTLTKLSTSEFMFYTKKRLESDEFNALFNKIGKFAENQPDNLIIILSSFAMRALNNKTLNVVALIRCGKNSKIKFTVKNFPSCIDPTYSGKNDSDKYVTYENISINDDKEIVFPELYIKGCLQHLTYNNVFQIPTLGGKKKLLGIDICLDHHRGVAKENCKKLIFSKLESSTKYIPTQLSHVVTSCTIDLKTEHSLENSVTHVDPEFSIISCKKGVSVETQTLLKPEHFGTRELNFIVTKPTNDNYLPKTLLPMVIRHNAKLHNPKHKKADMKRLKEHIILTGAVEKSSLNLYTAGRHYLFSSLSNVRDFIFSSNKRARNDSTEISQDMPLHKKIKL